MSKPSQPPLNAQSAAEALQLCAGVLPVWARQLASSRAQSEVAVSEMLQAFADIGPHINMAERQSAQITEALSASGDGVLGLSQACAQALAPVLQDPQLPQASRAAIENVLGMVDAAVQALESIAKPFTHETQMVAAQVERMYVGFQYQDRISQMMALLESDITRLQAVLGAQPDQIPELDAWLARLHSQYAMDEQRQSHAGGAPNAAADDHETTFF